MADTLDIQRDHESLIGNTMILLDSNGVLIFSTNRKKFKLDVGLLSLFDVKDITRDTIPEDFKRRPGIHHCWEIRHRAHG